MNYLKSQKNELQRVLLCSKFAPKFIAESQHDESYSESPINESSVDESSINES